MRAKTHQQLFITYGSACKDTSNNYLLRTEVRVRTHQTIIYYVWKCVQGHIKKLFITYRSACKDTSKNYLLRTEVPAKTHQKLFITYGSVCTDTSKHNYLLRTEVRARTHQKIIYYVRKCVQGHIKKLFITYGSACKETTKNYCNTASAWRSMGSNEQTQRIYTWIDQDAASSCFSCKCAPTGECRKHRKTARHYSSVYGIIRSIYTWLLISFVQFLPETCYTYRRMCKFCVTYLLTIRFISWEHDVHTWKDLTKVQSRVLIPSPRFSSLTSLITRKRRKKLMLIIEPSG